MFQLPADVPVYLHRAPVDFGLGINGLAATIEHAMQHAPLRVPSTPSATGAAIASSCCSGIATVTGYWLLVKRLEADRFAWPKQEATIMLTTEQLHWLLNGIDIEAVRRHPLRHYRHAG